ncbi:MAG: NADH-quinone oxidoreductase subunit NuoF [Deltaproteobacteria bacterium]|nr:NADH-quinone oxidoreductase subunit NuoF [Deltaproteobacteria bacterium]
MTRLTSISALEALRKEIISRRDPARLKVSVCSGTGCRAYDCDKVIDRLKSGISHHGLSEKVEVVTTGCHGFCELGPVMAIYPEGTSYFKIKPEDVEDIINDTLSQGKLVERLLYVDPEGQVQAKERDIPFYKYQNRVVFGNNHYIDPEHIEDYLALDGYCALAACLGGMTPEEVLETVKKANLRGRGGGGFPAGRKWETTRNAPGDVKYVIVNADEGDPGAYMDRSILEGNPHSVLEGMLIGAYAIGAHKGFIYIRQEYPLAVENLNRAIGQMRALGLLGENILGSGFDFEIAVHRGAGAFVSGESSALMSSIEGKVGEPRPKYIRTSISGVHGCPSDLNNVETWANVPIIFNKGVDWFTSIGTEGSKGTKIFSLVGKVNNTGLVEVPMGMTLHDIIFKIGGGIRDGKKFKAVQTGGPSGGVIPEDMLDLPVDFDALTLVGSMMGSGGMIVMDEDTCMVDVARYFLEFLADESCGKCVPCREGITQMLHILKMLCAGKGKPEDIDVLQEVAAMVKECSLCALGQSAPNPVLSSLKYFRAEYEAHVNDKCCPAHVCKELISYHIDPAKCKGCGKCLRNCPVNAISGSKKEPHVIDLDKCTKCDTCFMVCPPKFSAVTKLSGSETLPAV